jgi:hypothetical protein
MEERIQHRKQKIIIQGKLEKIEQLDKIIEEEIRNEKF